MSRSPFTSDRPALRGPSCNQEEEEGEHQRYVEGGKKERGRNKVEQDVCRKMSPCPILLSVTREKCKKTLNGCLPAFLDGWMDAHPFHHAYNMPNEAKAADSLM